MNELKKIYIGLPSEFKDKVLWIADNYRTNPLSHQPGGNDVIIEYTNGKIYAYDRIKLPSLYINKIVVNYFIKKSLSLNDLDKDEQVRIVKSEVRRLFARNYIDQDDYKTSAFEEIWDNQKSYDLPWESLKEFENRNSGTLLL
jgi:hypothetical protein